MAEIVLFHSALGPRRGVALAADILRAGGHTVHTPDVFRGEAIFDETGKAVAYCRSLGMIELMARARQAVEGLPDDLVFAGFSLGASFSAALAATRPGARAALLLQGAPIPEGLRTPSWPAAVAVEIHRMTDDRWVSQSSLRRLTKFVRASGAHCTVHDYPGSGHLFADPDLPDYDPAAAHLMWQRVLAFLESVDGLAIG
jgi:dienelactone hydrolase